MQMNVNGENFLYHLILKNGKNFNAVIIEEDNTHLKIQTRSRAISILAKSLIDELMPVKKLESEIILERSTELKESQF